MTKKLMAMYGWTEMEKHWKNKVYLMHISSNSSDKFCSIVSIIMINIVIIIVVVIMMIGDWLNDRWLIVQVASLQV